MRKRIAQINRWVADTGGRVYLAKDALLTPEEFNHMYHNNVEQWRDTLRDADPDGRFVSLMSERLGWKPWHGSNV